MNVKRQVFYAEGSAGSATASGSINVNGSIHAVELGYTNLPNTTDVTLSSGATEVLSKSNSNADETFYPRVAATKADGSASTLTEVSPVVRKLSVELSGGDPDGELEVLVWTE